MKARSIALLILVFFILLATGCAPVTPETITVKETVIREIPVTVEVTREPEITPKPDECTGKVTIPRTETFTLPASTADRDYDIYVALPERYEYGAMSYPVLYLLDGHLTFAQVTEYSRLLSAHDVIRNTIIVGINNSQNRAQDLLPTSDRTSIDKFLGFILEDLIPYVDENYRTKPADRILAGGSYGGSFVLYALFNSPDATFRRVIATTPALTQDDPVFQSEQAYAATHSDLPVKLFLSVGGRENPKYVETIYEILASRNYPKLDMAMTVIEGEGHIVTYLDGFQDGLRAVFR